MERELCGLGERAQQYQRQCHRVHAVVLDQIPGGENVLQLIAAHDVTNQQNACQQCQAATASDGQRHPCPAAGVLLVSPEADQQERCQAGQLPENHHQQQVARQHDAKHGAFEAQQKRVELTDVLVGLQVVAGVQDDQ